MQGAGERFCTSFLNTRFLIPSDPSAHIYSKTAVLSSVIKENGK